MNKKYLNCKKMIVISNFLPVRFFHEGAETHRAVSCLDASVSHNLLCLSLGCPDFQQIYR